MLSSGPVPLAFSRGRTNSSFLLKQPNSLEVDTSSLRKTRSEENMGKRAPRIVIGKTLTSKTPVRLELCREPRRGVAPGTGVQRTASRTGEGVSLSGCTFVLIMSRSPGPELVKQSAEESSSAEIDLKLEMAGLAWPLVV